MEVEAEIRADEESEFPFVEFGCLALYSVLESEEAGVDIVRDDGGGFLVNLWRLGLCHFRHDFEGCRLAEQVATAVEGVLKTFVFLQLALAQLVNEADIVALALTVALQKPKGK